MAKPSEQLATGGKPVEAPAVAPAADIASPVIGEAVATEAPAAAAELSTGEIVSGPWITGGAAKASEPAAPAVKAPGKP
ncbi:hypothetical protein EN863_067205, partial [Mesorhizobium sp. M00.F.Ca.ET.220.01.1.1]